MKGQSHLVIFPEPINWKLVPVELTALCRAVVANPTPVDSFTVAQGRIPEFNPLTTCPRCIEQLVGRDHSVSDGESGDTAPFYVYSIANRLEIEKREHKGDTIQNLENAVAKVQQ
jgi:hypothetical protein